MIEMAEIFRRYGPAYRAKYEQRMPSSHLKAMKDIEQCRTEALGGQVYFCEQCDETRYSYHSCQNRHCPKCQNQAAQQGLRQQQASLLPLPYFMVTFTLPDGLREVARSNQRLMYDLLFRTSAAALQELAFDPRFVGGQIGLVGVLQSWARDLSYHPHVHYLTPGGGLAADGQRWLPARKNFLVHVRPLGRLFRAKFRDELKKTDLFEAVSPAVWQQEWVVHCQPVGSGQTALKYLTPYIFRVAISNSRIVTVAEDQVTFRYKDGETGKTRYCTVTAEEFIRRFLQHVLPKGFVKVRYYGLFSPSQRPWLKQVRQLLETQAAAQATDEGDAQVTSVVEQTEPQTVSPPQEYVLACPKCGRPMRWVGPLKAKRCRSP